MEIGYTPRVKTRFIVDCRDNQNGFYPFLSAGGIAEWTIAPGLKSSIVHASLASLLSEQ